MSLCKKIKNFPKMNHNIFLKHFFFVAVISICFIIVANTFSQEPSLAQKVYEKYQTLLQREDIQALLPKVLEEIRKPESQKLLTQGTIAAVVDDPALLKQFIPDIEDEFITLLKEDQEVQAFLRDADVQTLLQDPAAIDELAALLEMNQLSLAKQVYEKHKDFFQRKDIREVLPDVLAGLKDPDIQALLVPATINLVVEDPDLLKRFVPNIDDEFITLLKEDAEVKAVISDPDVQLLLQDPAAIDELAALLSAEPVANVIVRIVPISVESPQVGEQLVITVDIADGEGVSGYEGTVQFDPTALRFVSLEHGSYFFGQVLSVPTAVKENQITFAQIAIETPASTTEGTLVTITFEVLNAKASTLTLSDVIIGGFGGVTFPVTIENAEILEPPKKPWDVNGDGRVNILDLTFVASHFGKEDAPPAADVNGDGRVNILDLTLVASHFGE